MFEMRLAGIECLRLFYELRLREIGKQPIRMLHIPFHRFGKTLLERLGIGKTHLTQFRAIERIPQIVAGTA